MISRELLAVALPFREGVPHDVWLAYHASYAGRISSVKQCLVQYRQHGGNALGMPGSVRKRRIDLYLRNKWRKLNVWHQLQKHQQALNDTDKRLAAMFEFESANGGLVSQELALLHNWSKERLQGRALDKYLSFFRSDNPALQLLNNRDNYCESPQRRAKKIRNRGYRSLILLVLLISPLFWLFFRIITGSML